MTIAVTGGIGSGKSAVCRYLGSMGAAVYDADSRTKLLYDSCPAIVDGLEEAFGCSLRTAGTLDRRKLASIIFGDSKALETLEGIVHPAVLEDFLSWREGLAADVPLVVFESAIILRKKEFMDVVDKVILLEAPVETRLDRVCKRDDTDRSQVLARMDAQSFDCAAVDAVISNSGTKEELYREVDRVLGSFDLKITEEASPASE